MPKITVYTTQLGKYNGKDLLDITVKSGNKVFAPNWSMVIAHKEGHITDKEYTGRYMNMMRLSYKLHRAQWDWLMKQKSIALACYCPADAFCHRHILKNIIQTICKKRGITFIDGYAIRTTSRP